MSSKPRSANPCVTSSLENLNDDRKPWILSAGSEVGTRRVMTRRVRAFLVGVVDVDVYHGEGHRGQVQGKLWTVVCPTHPDVRGSGSFHVSDLLLIPCQTFACRLTSN